MRRAAWMLVLLALAAAAVYSAVSVYAAGQLSTTGTHLPLQATPESIGPDWEDVTFPSRTDHLRLSGWLFHAPRRTGRSAIALHGFTSNRTDAGFGMPAFTRDLLAAGYDTLVFDFRSFGRSEGGGFTIGWREGRDVLGAYDFMRGRGYDPAQMAIVGISMGAESMLGVAEQLGPVAALVADSAYAELRPIIELNLHRYSPLPALFYPGIIEAGTLFYGLNPDFRPIDHVRALPQRAFLFFVGGRDDFIPPDNSRRLRAASANPGSRLVVFEGSGHVQGYHDERDRYLRELFAFIDEQVARRRG